MRRIGVLGFLLSGCALFYVSDTSGAAARQQVASGARLLDVRSPDEYAAGHIDGAVNIPVGDLPARLGEVGSKETPVVVYCRSGHRAAKAQKILVEAGFREVHNLGPMSYW